MFKQPFLFLSQQNNQQKQRFSHANEDATTFAYDAGMLPSMPAASAFASKLTGGKDSSSSSNNSSNNNSWTNREWYMGRAFCSSRAISASTNSIGNANTRGGGGPSPQPSLSAEQNKYEYTNCSHNTTNLNAYYCEAGKANTTANYNNKNNRDRSDSDTATATTTQTSPTASMLSDYSLSEDEHEEDTIEFFLEDIDESVYGMDGEKEDGDGHDFVDKAITNGDNFGHDDVEHDHDNNNNNDDYDYHWSNPKQVRRNASFVIRETLDEAKEASMKTTTTTKTKTTTTTTTTHTTAATTMATKHKNKNIFVYPHLFPGNSESVIQATANVGKSQSKNDELGRVPATSVVPYDTGRFPKKISNSNDLVVPYNRPEGNTAIVTAPETAMAGQRQQQSCPCCASKQRKIERQGNELKHMKVLVKKLCGLLADTVLPKKNNSDGHNRLAPPAPNQEAITNYSHNETRIISASPKICSSNEKDSSAANTSTSLVASSPTTSLSSSSSLSPSPRRNISSLSVTSVGAHCPRSKKRRIEVNGNSATYSGPTIATETSEHYQRAAILQGCVVRFDNGELYVGSLGRNDTGSLTFHPPGTLYDCNRTPKRRVR